MPIHLAVEYVAFLSSREPGYHMLDLTSVTHKFSVILDFLARLIWRWILQIHGKFCLDGYGLRSHAYCLRDTPLIAKCVWYG